MVTPLKATRVGVGKRYLNYTTQVVGNFGRHDDDDATCSHEGRETKKERVLVVEKDFMTVSGNVGN